MLYARILLFTLLLGATPLAAAEDIVSSLRGWPVVVAEDAIPSETHAAEECVALLGQITGEPVSVTHDPPESGPCLLIGPGAASSAGLNIDGLGDEGLSIRVQPDRIAIAGGRPRGTLYGVYEFFERHFGVRFLTFDHTYIPEDAAERAVPVGDYEFTPAFSFRWSYYRENSAHPEFAAKARVNTVSDDEKLGGKTPQSLINHTLYRQLPVEKYGNEHPEYFALVDGERKLDMHGGGPEPCVTHPDVIEIVAEAVIQELDANPAQRNISVSQNDNDAYCRCDRCEAVNQAEGTPMGSHLAFVNAVAERVEKKHPQVKVGTLAYWYTRKPPKTIRPRDNIQIQLCSIECCTLHAIDDPGCEKNREFCADLAAWKEISDDIWVWNYNTNFSNYDLPFPNLRSIGPNVMYFLNNNVHGLFMQANGNGLSGEMSDLRNYVIARAMWHPQADSWALAEEFCRLHYGPAAAPILEYLTLLHDNAEARGVHPTCFPTTTEVGLDQELAVRAMSLFEDATKATDDPAIQARVEKASICAHQALLATAQVSNYQDGKCTLNVPDAYADIVDRYIAVTAKHNLTMASERQSIGEFMDTIRGLADGVAAERIENDTWRVTVLPEYNGKVTEMLHKPSGRDLVNPRGRMFNRHRSHEDWGAQGIGRDETFKFDASKEGNVLTLTTTQEGRFDFVRTVSLPEEAPGKIRFEATLTHRGDAPQVYQLWIHPEYDAATHSTDDKVIEAFVKEDGWRKFNERWNIDDGPGSKLMEDAKGGAYAFYNKEAGFGVVQTYDPREMDRPDLWWHPGRSQVNLELYTVSKELQPGESMHYGYSVAYLNERPKAASAEMQVAARP